MLQGSTCFGAMERSESTAWNSLVDRSFGEDWRVNLENLESFFGERVLLAWEKMLKCCKKKMVSNTFQRSVSSPRSTMSDWKMSWKLRPRRTKFHKSTPAAGLQYPRGLGTVDFDRSIQDDKGVVKRAAAQRRMPCVFFGFTDCMVWIGAKEQMLLAFHNGRLWRTGSASLVASSEKQKVVFADFSLFNPTMFSRLIHVHIVRSNSVCKQHQQNLCLMISPLEEQWLGHQ